MKTQTKIITAVIGYILMAGFTYGYAYNVRLQFENSKFPNWEATNRLQAEDDGFFCGLAWPIYWPGHIAKNLWPNEKS